MHLKSCGESMAFMKPFFIAAYGNNIVEIWFKKSFLEILHKESKKFSILIVDSITPGMQINNSCTLH